MIQVSCLASPGGVAPGQCHCSQRPELTSAPSSSAKQVVGSSRTSVWMLAVSTSLCAPWFSQKCEVSVDRGSITTSIFSLDRPAVTLPRSGMDSIGLKPWQKYRFTRSLFISSNMRRMS